jgi:hypothetical protein
VPCAQAISKPARSDHTLARANVQALAIKSDPMPLQNTKKLLVWAGSAIKTCGTKKNKEVAREMQAKVSTPITGKTGHVLLSTFLGCCILILSILGFSCQFIHPLDVAICSMK